MNAGADARGLQPERSGQRFVFSGEEEEAVERTGWKTRGMNMRKGEKKEKTHLQDESLDWLNLGPGGGELD